MVSSSSQRRAQSWVIFYESDGHERRKVEEGWVISWCRYSKAPAAVCLFAHSHKRTSLLGYTLQTASRKWIKSTNIHTYILEKKKKNSHPSIIQSALPGESSESISEHSGSHTDVCTHKIRAAIISSSSTSSSSSSSRTHAHSRHQVGVSIFR